MQRSQYQIKNSKKTIWLVALFGVLFINLGHAANDSGGNYVSTTGAEYVHASATKKLLPGQKIFNIVNQYDSDKTIIQRLTDKTYWIGTDSYATVAYVGEQGVLLMDPLGWGKGKAVLKAVKTITPKPITAVIYSHQHKDHIDDIDIFIKEAQARGIQNLRIIASDKTQSILKDSWIKWVPLATEVIPFHHGETTFEDQTIKVIGFNPAAHIEDSAVWLLVEDRVAHAPDMYNPDQIHYRNFGMSQTYTNYRHNMEMIKSLEWDFFSGGHGNIGGKKDIDFILTFTEDLELALKAARKVYSSDSKVINHAIENLRGKYGKYHSFEKSLPSQAKMVLAHLKTQR